MAGGLICLSYLPNDWRNIKQKVHAHGNHWNGKRKSDAVGMGGRSLHCTSLNRWLWLDSPFTSEHLGSLKSKTSWSRKEVSRAGFLRLVPRGLYCEGLTRNRLPANVVRRAGRMWTQTAETLGLRLIPSPLHLPMDDVTCGEFRTSEGTISSIRSSRGWWCVMMGCVVGL